MMKHTAKNPRVPAFFKDNPNPVLSCDPDGIITYVNPAARRIAKRLGHPNIETLLPHNHSELVQTAFAKKKSCTVDIAFNGYFLAWFYYPIPGDGMLHIYGHEVQEAREYAASIVDTVHEPLLILDAELRVVSASRSFYQAFQVTSTETEGQLLYELGNRQWDIPKLRELLEDILPKNTTFENFEVEQDFEGLGSRVMLLNARRTYSKANETPFILLAIEDITARKRAEKELKEAQEELMRNERLVILGQLAGGVAHELRNPLGAIKNATYFLNLAIEQPDSEEKEALDVLKNEVAISERIISSLLDFARPRTPTREKVDVNDLIQETLARISVPVNIRVTCTLAQELPPVLVDPYQLSQVFRNLFHNARQAMPNGGRLVVKTEATEPGWVAVIIADTGEGIAKENLDRIYEPLFTTKAKGIGLGLAVVKTLVERHNGTIEVTSEVGTGSTFTVKLPRGETQEHSN
ncbi:MAG: ATP-binding protein [Gammaproteobacteria bacterium]|nr:ATP-binding protein [Gammaproteobacteria bacterium]